MIVDGRAIAKKLRSELKEEIPSFGTLSLTHFVGTDDPAIQSFVRIKQTVADELGVTVIEEDVRDDSTESLVAKITASTSDGIIVQFPLPEGVDPIRARNAIPLSRDVDAISDTAMQAFENGAIQIMPPVAGAMQEIIDVYGIGIKGKKVVIVGNGWLVGKPAAILFQKGEANVTVLDRQTTDIETHTKDADIVVLGAGSPGLLTPNMIKEGAVVFDAGTSEEGGKLIGDADPACAAKCSIFTPVPGGIGPITVAYIFKNLLALKKTQK